jgi:transposase
MKKDSKAARTRTAVETIGIDLGDKTSQYCILNEAGDAVEQGSFRNQPTSITAHFGGRAPARIALEVGSQSAWISRELEKLGHGVIVANARQLKWITASDTKNDRADAEKLARLARADQALLAPIEHRTAEQQAELAVIRARDALVRARTLLVNAARGIAKGFGHRLPPTVSETFGKRACLLLPETLQPALENLLEEIGGLSKLITAYEEKIGSIARRHPEVERLTSIPGVGTLTGLTFVLTLGRADRFEHSRDVGGYIGLRPRQQQSGARDPQLGIAKSGDKYLRKLLVQCAHHVLGRFGKDSALRQWGLAKAEGSKNATKRVIVAVARKLAVLLHRLWVTGEIFKPFPQMG